MIKVRKSRLSRIAASIGTVLSVLGAGGLAPALAVDATGDLRVWVDHAAFRMAPGAADAYVEFYFEMKRSDFVFRRLDDLIRADVYCWVHVSDSAGTPVDSVGGAFIAVVNDSAELSDRDYTLFFARALELRPGNYRARVVVVDLTNKASSEAAFPFRAPDFSGERLMLSDIEFGYDITEAPSGMVDRPLDVLVKNQYKVYPDCRGLVGSARPRLFFYVEAYNLAFDPGRDNAYTVAFSLVPTDGSPIPSAAPQTLTKPGTSAVLASAVSVRDLKSGPCRFRVDVTDPASGQTVSAEKGFHVVLPPVDSLTPDEVQRLHDIIAYIAKPAETETFNALSPVGKRNFMIQFWKDRDPTPETPTNEFRDEHLRRMNYANERFSVGFKERSDGWRTHRGRVYVVYGPPDHVDRYPFTPESKAVERWQYQNLPGQGLVHFLFVDEGGYGDYRLVHSNARGERRDPAWERLLQSGDLDRPR